MREAKHSRLVLWDNPEGDGVGREVRGRFRMGGQEMGGRFRIGGHKCTCG